MPVVEEMVSEQENRKSGRNNVDGFLTSGTNENPGSYFIPDVFISIKKL